MVDTKASAGRRSGFASTASGAITLSLQGDALVLEVAGSLDVALAPKLRQLADRAVSAAPELLVIDLTMVHFLSATGIAELVRIHLARPEAPVHVVAADRVVLRPLELTRPAGELAVYPTLAAALGRV
jgi:anti-sigma B factor antagonist